MVVFPDDIAIDYIEMYVADLAAKTLGWVDRYGFTVAGTGGSAEHRSVALRNGPVTLVLTEGTSDQHPASAAVLTHGDTVADIALRTADVPRAVAAAVAHDVPVLRPVTRHTDAAVTAAISAFGDVTHTLIQRAPGHSPGLPAGFAPALNAETARVSDIGLVGLDHIAVCLDTGTLPATVQRYQRALGFTEIFEEHVIAPGQAMESKVVRSQSGAVTLTFIEPDPQAGPGQVDDFLKNHHGAGVEHLSFASADAVAAAWSLAGRGVSLLGVPEAYYHQLGERMRPRHHTLAELRAAGVLADQDDGGELFQIFTRSTHARRTLFFEVIERQGARTFGAANIRALYQAMELSADRPAS